MKRIKEIFDLFSKRFLSRLDKIWRRMPKFALKTIGTEITKSMFARHKFT